MASESGRWTRKGSEVEMIQTCKKEMLRCLRGGMRDRDRVSKRGRSRSKKYIGER